MLMVLDYVRWAKHDFHLIETSTISTSVAVVDALRTEGIHGMHFLGNTHAPSIFPVTGSCYWLIKGIRFHYKDQIATVPVIQSN